MKYNSFSGQSSAGGGEAAGGGQMTPEARQNTGNTCPLEIWKIRDQGVVLKWVSNVLGKQSGQRFRGIFFRKFNRQFFFEARHGTGAKSLSLKRGGAYGVQGRGSWESYLLV